MRILVCGGRDFRDRALVYDFLNDYAQEHKIKLLVQGGAPGVDAAARDWARENKIACATFHAYWREHGDAAGPIRNAWMIEHGKPDVLIAFPGGNGTADMVDKAMRRGIEIVKVSV